MNIYDRNPGSLISRLVMTLFLSFIYLLIVPASPGYSQEVKEEVALIIVDVQMFYFPGGSSPLVDPEKASLNAGRILAAFRQKNLPVIHVRHNTKQGSDIHPNVAPLRNEKVISKNRASSFYETDLLEYLKELNVSKLVICGMMTHMCVEATTRAASDLGFECTVIGDACTTKDLRYESTIIKANDVHLSTLSTLSGTYAKILETEKWIKTFHSDEKK